MSQGGRKKEEEHKNFLSFTRKKEVPPLRKQFWKKKLTKKDISWKLFRVNHTWTFFLIWADDEIFQIVMLSSVWEKKMENIFCCCSGFSLKSCTGWWSRPTRPWTRPNRFPGSGSSSWSCPSPPRWSCTDPENKGINLELITLINLPYCRIKYISMNLLQA